MRMEKNRKKVPGKNKWIIMENGKNKRWLVYLVIFFVILAAIILVCRLSPSESGIDSNLLVNSVAALFFTGMIALIDNAIRHWKNKK